MDESKLPEKSLGQTVEIWNHSGVKAIAGISSIAATLVDPLAGGVMAMSNEILHLMAHEWNRRRKIFLEELDTENTPINEETVKNPEFLHFLGKAYQGAQSSYTEEKIRRFAKMLKGIVNAGMLSDIDENEEHFKLLNELSDREWALLLILAQYQEVPMERRNQPSNVRKIAIYWDSFIAEAESQLSLSKEGVLDIGARLVGSGLMTEFRTGDHGWLACTPTFFKLKELIESKSSEQDVP